MNDFERKNINIRNFDPSLDNFSGNTIYNQYLWVLSSEEFNKLEQEVKIMIQNMVKNTRIMVIECLVLLMDQLVMA